MGRIYYLCNWNKSTTTKSLTHSIMKNLIKATYGTPSIEVIEETPAGVLCASNTNGGNTEDLFFEDWQKLLGGGGVL